MTSVRFSFNEYLINFYNNNLIGTVGRKKIPNNKPQFYDIANKLLWRPTEKDNITFTSYISSDAYSVDSKLHVRTYVHYTHAISYIHLNVTTQYK